MTDLRGLVYNYNAEICLFENFLTFHQISGCSAVGSAPALGRFCEAPPVADEASRSWRSGRKIKRKAQILRAPQEGVQCRQSFSEDSELTIKNRGVAQLVARLLWEQDAGCSSHLTPTNTL